MKDVCIFTVAQALLIKINLVCYGFCLPHGASSMGSGRAQFTTCVLFLTIFLQPDVAEHQSLHLASTKKSKIRT